MITGHQPDRICSVCKCELYPLCSCCQCSVCQWNKACREYENAMDGNVSEREYLAAKAKFQAFKDELNRKGPKQ